MPLERWLPVGANVLNVSVQPRPWFRGAVQIRTGEDSHPELVLPVKDGSFYWLHDEDDLWKKFSGIASAHDQAAAALAFCSRFGLPARAPASDWGELGGPLTFMGGPPPAGAVLCVPLAEVLGQADALRAHARLSVALRGMRRFKGVKQRADRRRFEHALEAVLRRADGERLTEWLERGDDALGRYLSAVLFNENTALQVRSAPTFSLEIAGTSLHGLCVLSLARTLAAGTAALRLCLNDRCHIQFRPKHGGQNYCTTACGGRARAMRFYKNQRRAARLTLTQQ